MPARIAIIGGGVFGEMHLKTFTQMQSRGEIELVGLADIDEKVRARRREQYGVKTYADHRRMLRQARPDGVTVVTPDHLHRAVVVDALKAGCHVMVEKPMAQSVTDCQKMIDAAAERGLLLMVDFHKRFSAQNAELRRAVRAGALGQVEYAYAWMEDRIEVPRDWWPHWAVKSSPMWFLGVHMIDLMRWATGLEAVSVSAVGQTGKLKSAGVNTWDAIQAQIRFANGACFSLHTSWILPEAFESIVNQGIRVVGSEGIIEIDSQDRGERSCLGGRMSTYNLEFYREVKRPDGGTEYAGYGIDSIAVFAEHVGHLLSGGTLAGLAGKFGTAEDGLEVTRIAAAVHQSLRRGRPVAVR